MSRRDRYADRAGPPDAVSCWLTDPAPPPLVWLWPNRIPLTCLTLLIADPGVGKSLLTADLAARLTVPHRWPDDPAAERPDPAALPPLPPHPTDEDVRRSFPPIRGFLTHQLAPTDVVFAAPEDRPVLRDRLVAAGADLQYISVLDGVRPPFTQDLCPLRLPGHADQLEMAIRAHSHPSLVVLDPIHALLDDGVYCSPARQADLLSSLADIARRRGLAILAIGHFTKTPSRRTLYRVRGSLSLVAAARSVLVLTPDPDQPDRRILTQIKNAYGPLAPPLAFRIVPSLSEIPNLKSPVAPHRAEPDFLAQISNLKSEPPAEISSPQSSIPNRQFPISSTAPHLVWDDPAQSDWRLSTGVLDLSPDSFSVLSEACDWLTDFLSAGPRPAREILSAARAAGIPRSTLFRAKRLLNIPSRRTGPNWSWLPRSPPSE